MASSSAAPSTEAPRAAGADRVPRKLRLAATLEGHDGAAWTVAWNPARRLLASCSTDKTVRVWSWAGAGSWSCVAKLEDFVTRTVRCVAWSPSGELLAATSFDGDTAIWRCSGGAAVGPDAAGAGGAVRFEAVASLQGHENEVKGAAWSADGSMLATSGRDKNVWVWEADESGEFECAGVLTGHSQDVKSVRWLPGGANGAQELLSCSYDNSARVWREDPDTGDWTTTQVLEGHGSTVWSAAVSPAGDAVATVDHDGRIIVWKRAAADAAPGAAWAKGVTGDVSRSRACLSVDWSPDGDVLATAGADDTLRVIAVDATRSALDTLAEEPGAHDGEANCASWCPWPAEGGRMLASCGDDGAVRVWLWE
ncbi:hypothetical protein FNF27_02028 [Cafeteria roenbergensis]|uniref:Probable cytosolic iron-sulfur protein assembly protein CIAO1 homolog n=1 Tax=Cafeteria roenbergensis TaxID=33653 RepID=A0A5A8EKL6_CAFRO|nr:hypothetical protein FNF27_02028 [Cafeteria roenbergensis]|mmetsp:Transcript_488/g.1855  ORF Transcript_488/g.1855 Transcript_488/m.1855 type:complete len:367 (+) Transcript_488:127-1227(+)